ncbi:zinc-binding dehydrogenase [Pseudomarimonas salicorniae]|uniref:Zinc-binding dehydrogenase n=1 Tax=Pseudomarimonas salicorniae TaxID=2933270 RepID=A0ABT0GHM1_9GAMM|nr:zinc-binding dehydrogenase [Lysobacter sp. CAU 1642]MCK7594041.1 zinc-binding dehydrogenase [Lysobacter sp. CAU 1642]
MHAIRIDRPGGFDALRQVELPEPAPGHGQVRVVVHACGVNYADGIIRMGLYASAKALHGYPIIPGFEIAGVIDALGPGVEGWKVGERVLAPTLFGGYCDAIVLDAGHLFRVPAGLDMAQAASLPTVFLTAWFLAHRKLHPRPGDRWLVHSAAGGVGGALLQLGRLAGCRCIGVVGHSDKVALARELGAEAVLVRDQGKWWHRARELAPEGFEAVFDASGVATLRHSYALLAPTGSLVIYGFHSMLPRDGRLNWLRLAWDWLRTPRFNPLDMTQSNRSVVAANLSFLQSHAPTLRSGLDWLLSRFEEGALRPPPLSTYPLAEAARAQRDIESGRTQGKLVLTTRHAASTQV